MMKRAKNKRENKTKVADDASTRTKKLRKRKLPEENIAEDLSTLDGSIEYLEKRCHPDVVLLLRGNVHIKTAMGVIEGVALTNGLPIKHIKTLIDVIGSGKLSRSTTNRLVKSLIPSSRIPAFVVMSVISWLSTQTLHSSTQLYLVRWMLLVFNLIDDKDTIHRLYGILFQFVHCSLLRIHTCHLLYLLTRKEDVQIFRVQALLNLKQRQCMPQHLMAIDGLLAVYKLYQPHLVALSFTKSKKMFFSCTDHVWAAKIKQVASNNGMVDSLLADDSETIRPEPADFLVTSNKKQKQGEVVSMARIQQLVAASSLNTRIVPYSQIRNFQQLLKNIDSFELPSHLAIVFHDQNLQHALLCRHDPAASLRIQYWLNNVLNDEFLTGMNCNVGRQERFLKLLINFSDFLQEGLPVCDEFLANYLKTWNGTTHVVHIFNLLSRCRLSSFDELNSMFLEYIRKLFFCSSAFFKCQTIICFTKMLQNFAQVEWPRYKYNIALQSDSGSSSQYLPDHFSVFTQEIDAFPVLQTIVTFIQFVDNICFVGLQQENYNILLTHCVLEFFEQAASLYSSYGVPLFCIPSEGIVYPCLVHQNAMIVSQICSLVCSYRELYGSLRSSAKTDLTQDDHAIRRRTMQNSLKSLNVYMLDMCDMLWRSRTFSPEQSESSIIRLVCKGISEQIKLPNINRRFSIYLHSAFLGYACKFLKITQSKPTNGFVYNPLAIKDHKELYLEFFDREHLNGITSFIRTCIKRNSILPPSSSQVSVQGNNPGS